MIVSLRDLFEHEVCLAHPALKAALIEFADADHLPKLVTVDQSTCLLDVVRQWQGVDVDDVQCEVSIPADELQTLGGESFVDCVDRDHCFVFC